MQYTHGVKASGGGGGGPGSVTLVTGRCGDSMDWSSKWSVSYWLRGNLQSLFNVPTPLRWKFLRFPNVMQCDAQLTTQVWCLQNTQYIHKPTQIHYEKRPIMISKQFPESKGSILVLHLFTAGAHWNELLLLSAWTSLFVLTHEHTSSRTSQCTHSQQCCVEPCRQFPLLRYWAAFSHPRHNRGLYFHCGSEIIFLNCVNRKAVI